MDIKTWKRNQRRGNYSLLMGSMCFIVVGFAAFAVDIGLITMAELQAQATADAASHAALVVFRDAYDWSGNPAPAVAAGNNAAQFIVAKNKVAMGTAILDQVQYGNYNFETRLFQGGINQFGANAVRARVSRQGSNTVDLLLAPILGVDHHDVNANAITAQQRRAVMLVQDMSCSMMYGAGVGVLNSRIGATAFMDYLESHPQEGDKIGLAMFASYGVTEPSATNQNGGASNSYTATPWLPLKLIETNAGLIQTRIDGICNTLQSNPCPTPPTAWHPVSSEIGEMTNPAPGMRQAINQLILGSNKTFFRGMVVMSDGVPTAGEGQTGAVNASNAAWAEDIHVWSIVFHNGSFDLSNMQALVRGSGFMQSSTNAGDLAAMFETVARSLPTALVD